MQQAKRRRIIPEAVSNASPKKEIEDLTLDDDLDVKKEPPSSSSSAKSPPPASASSSLPGLQREEDSSSGSESNSENDDDEEESSDDEEEKGEGLKLSTKLKPLSKEDKEIVPRPPDPDSSDSEEPLPKDDGEAEGGEGADSEDDDKVRSRLLLKAEIARVTAIYLRLPYLETDQHYSAVQLGRIVAGYALMNRKSYNDISKQISERTQEIKQLQTVKADSKRAKRVAQVRAKLVKYENQSFQELDYAAQAQGPLTIKRIGRRGRAEHKVWEALKRDNRALYDEAMANPDRLHKILAREEAKEDAERYLNGEIGWDDIGAAARKIATSKMNTCNKELEREDVKVQKKQAEETDTIAVNTCDWAAPKERSVIWIVGHLKKFREVKRDKRLKLAEAEEQERQVTEMQKEIEELQRSIYLKKARAELLRKELQALK